MGQDENAVTEQNNEDLENLEESTDAEEVETEGEATGEEDQDGGEGDGSPDAAQAEVENEIVLEGETQPQEDQVPAGFFKRINKLNGKNAKLQGENSEVTQENSLLKEEVKLLRMAVDQSKGQAPAQELKRPDPNDFDGGYIDDEYIKADNDYIEAKIAEGSLKAFEQYNKKSEVIQNEKVDSQGLQEKQKAHYERASKLNVKDYEDTEDKALAILGTENANHLIKGLPKDTEKILYHLGKNPKKAERYAEMFKTRDGTIEALVELGGLVTKIKVKPKTTSAPDTDTNPKGGKAPGGGKLRGPKGATFV